MTPFRRLLPLSLAVLACTPDAVRGPVDHEFLVSAGDSTYWLHADPDGNRVRSSPLLVARVDGRFFELYVTDDDRSYFEAILIGQRLYRRDLISGDSLLVFEDSLIPSLARLWAATHSGARRLAPDEEASDDPHTYATAELEIIDLHGPYLSYEYHADIETRDGDESHHTRRGVIDIREGGAATLAMLYGREAARRIEAEGRRRFTATVDSMLAAGGNLGVGAAAALAGFAFDSRSFTVVAVGSESGVLFLIPGQGEPAGGLTLELDPIPAGTPEWWERIRSTLPVRSGDPLIDRWTRPTYDVLARYADTGETATLALRDSVREWTLATVPGPVQRIEWLDSPPLDSVSRRALSRAFDEAALYDETTRIVRREPDPRAWPIVLALSPSGHR